MQFAILTQVQAADLDPCRLLCESAQRFVSGDFRQYLIVEGRLAGRFRPLAGPRVEILEVESLVPRGIRWQMGWAPEAARGAIARLAAASAIGADAFILAGPGVAFVRPFDPASLQCDDRLRLYRAPGEARQFPHIGWHRAASRLLGLPMTDYFGANYAADLTAWRRDALGPLRERVELATGKPWLRALATAGEFSDAILYGVFAEHLLPALHRFEATPACHGGWPYDLASEAGVRRFFDDIGPSHAAVRIPADAPIAVEHCRRRIGIPTPNLAAHRGAAPKILRPRPALNPTDRAVSTPHSGTPVDLPIVR
ncbi:MAG: DUF6492 family protein [Isosphaeraceae bacterium]